jgi:hypothetical protein
MNHPTTRTSSYPSVDQADVFRGHKPQRLPLQQQEDLRLPLGLRKPKNLPLMLEQIYITLDDIRSIAKPSGITPEEAGAIWSKVDLIHINLNVFLHTRDWSQFKHFPVLP